jgi:protease II
MVLFESITLSVSLIDTTDTTIEVKIYTLTGEEYEAWGNDDTYIVNWVKSKLQEEEV